ncbi:hypothetical protein ACZ90_30240 [Streptomyces albus subsp. albus]|nr:hypothetical protein ACZ90_30240 [Streptomyces albus subsp. albus]
MTQIIKGGNLPVSSEPVRIAVVRQAAGPGVPKVDAAALLLDASGRVRGHHDLVFHNQPAHATSALHLMGSAHGEDGRTADWLQLDPARVEPSVQRIVIAASSDGGAFGAVPGLYVEVVSAATGARQAVYVVEGATTETAFVLGEFYRRNGGWKFRAVGQGYASGLPGLAADHGLTVPREAPGPAAVPAPAAPPLPVAAPVPPGAVGTPMGYAAPMAASAAAAMTGAPPAVTAPRNGLPAGFGPEFPVFEQRGAGSDVILVDVAIPVGFVVVDVVKKGDGYLEIKTLDHRNQDKTEILSSWIEDLRGRGLLDHDGHGPLRLHVDTDDEWTVTVRPISALREVSTRLEGHGPDVLAHSGPAVDLAIEHRGDEDGEGYFGLEAISPNGERDDLFSTWDRGRGTVPLTEGPRLLVIEASGAWSIDPRYVSHQRPAGDSGDGFWSRRH